MIEYFIFYENIAPVYAQYEYPCEFSVCLKYPLKFHFTTYKTANTNILKLALSGIVNKR